MITHYGLFWSVDDVFWGRQNNEGKMLGNIAHSDGLDGNDYRDFMGVYCLYNAGQLIYIGRAGFGVSKRTNQIVVNKNNLFGRLKKHKNEKNEGYWDQFSWFGCKKTDIDNGSQFNQLKAICQLEAITIAIVNPRFNRQSGDFRGAHKVKQRKHQQAYGSTDVRLARIDETLKQVMDKLTI